MQNSKNGNKNDNFATFTRTPFFINVSVCMRARPRTWVSTLRMFLCVCAHARVCAFACQRAYA